jgi:P-type Cu2+ transporter
MTAVATSVAIEARATPVCAHCGLPVPEGAPMAAATACDPGDSGASAEPRFCCTGCEAVWHTLHSCGLEQYYALQRAAGQRPNRPEQSSHAYLDHTQFQTRHVRGLPGGRAAVELRVDGLKCGACLWLLEAMPRLVPGLLRARVDLGRSVLELEWLPAQVPLSTVADRVASLGYQLRPLGTLASREEWRRQDRAWLVQIGVAGAISSNVMAIAFALYGAHFSWMDAAAIAFFQWTSVALAALAIAWPGRVFLRNAVSAIRTRTPHMDLPIALALVAGLGGGAAMTALGREGVYLESVSMLVFLLLVGRFVQFRQQRKARHEVELLCALVPQTARRALATGEIEEVPVDALQAGDRVRVGAGDALPADGSLCDAEAHVDLQMITGESRPVRVRRGERVLAGSRAVGSPIELQVTEAGDRTRAAHIVRMVEQAAGQRPRVVEFANRIAGWFLLAVLAVALVVGTVWWFIDPARMPAIVVALLVVTCPCALGLATPLTMVASLGKAARRGMLVRGGDVLERLARVGTVVLDKTGTVTEGTQRVVELAGCERAALRAAALEQDSVHPTARALRDWAAGRAGQAHAAAAPIATSVERVREHAGQGVEGTVDGLATAAGNARLMRALGVAPDTACTATADAMTARGLSPVFVAEAGRVRAVLGVGDPIRSDAAALVRAVQRRGWHVRLASGDVPALARAVGRTLGLADAVGGCAPEDKMRLVADCAARPVVMVGDGVNDLPAMAAADVGVAVRQGAQATVATADVALTGGGLGQLVQLLDGSRRTMRTIHINFAISLAYNLVGGTLAATGLISPLIAAILMPLSGLTVTAVALRMPRFDAPVDTEDDSIAPASPAPTSHSTLQVHLAPTSSQPAAQGAHA